MIWDLQFFSQCYLSPKMNQQVIECERELSYHFFTPIDHCAINPICSPVIFG